jgi:hypothetical protein
MIQYCLPNNIILFFTIDKFDSNPILVNINKLKPYIRFINDNILQPRFAKPSDLTIKAFVQEELLESLLVEDDIFEHAVFEPVTNDFTNGPIIIHNIPLYNHHNDIHVHNYQSDIPIAMTKNVYSLEAITLKGVSIHNHKIVLSQNRIKNYHKLCCVFLFCFILLFCLMP